MEVDFFFMNVFWGHHFSLAVPFGVGKSTRNKKSFCYFLAPGYTPRIFDHFEVIGEGPFPRRDFSRNLPTQTQIRPPMPR